VPVPRIERYSFAGRLERAPDAGGFRYAVERNEINSLKFSGRVNGFVHPKHIAMLRNSV